jgi:hypothetical protein
MEAQSDQNLIRVKFLKNHPQFAYIPGDLCYLRPDHVEILLPDGYIELIPDDYQEPLPQGPKTYKDSEYIQVVFIKPHAGFSYSTRDRAVIAPDRINELLEGGYVQLLPENKGLGQKIIDKLKHK